MKTPVSLKNALLSLLVFHDVSTHVVAFRGRTKGFQADDGRRHLETKAVKCSKSETATDTLVECGGTYSGSVTLTRNLRCTSSTGITLNGPGTTLDCQGKAIIGDPTSTSTGIQANDGVTIQNCIVTGVDGTGSRAIFLNGGMSSVLDTDVINTSPLCSSNRFCGGIELEGVAGDEYTINGVRVYGFGGEGIKSSGSSSITIRNTVAAGNGRSGITIVSDATEVTIEDTASFQNGNDGISMRDTLTGSASISGLNAFENSGDGFDIEASSTVATLSNVESVFNGDGAPGNRNLELLGDVTFGENVYACYGNPIDVGSFSMTTGDAICDTAKSDNFNCTGQCDANGTAAATVCVPK